MLRIGKQQNSIRLPEMTAIPSSDDLQFLLSKAQRNWRCAVELPFKTPDGLATFIVIVKCEMGTGAPCWSLYRADQSGMPVVWSHISTDMLLIHNLISLESAGVSQKSGMGEISFSPDRHSGYAANGIQSEMCITHSRIMSVPDSAASQSQVMQSPAGAALTHSRIMQPEAPLTSSRLMHVSPPAKELEQEAELDPDLMRSVEWSLKRAETGIFTYPALLYFLHQEHVRFQRGGQPFTVIVFDMYASDGRELSELPVPAVREACSRICQLKRTLDMVAHYEAYDYAFLLPHTDTTGGAIFLEKIAKALIESPLMPGLPIDAIDVRFGLAAVPEDCQKPAQVLSAAAEAKRYARENGSGLVFYRDIRNSC